MQKRKVLVVTDKSIWRLQAGAHARTCALVDYLGTRTDLTVAALGPAQPGDEDILSGRPRAWGFVWLARDRELGPKEYARRVHEYCVDNNVDVCIIERLHLAYLREALPPGVRAFIDTHDLVSVREAALRAHRLRDEHTVTRDQEFAILGKFDRTILIQQEDYADLCIAIGAEKCILTPHPVDFSKQTVRPRVGSIGFVASGWIANIHAMKWFLEDIWPLVRRPGLTFDIHGRICSLLTEISTQGLVLKGYGEDLDAVYGAIDIVVNPIRAGAGLKIKSVEALGNGLPLVTTTEGARGLPASDRPCLLIADDTAAFAGHLNRLIDDPDLRQRLAQSAYDYARRYFSADACYGSLIAEIDQAP
jgi:glycosyltransferase involved in cell wall biosynthesis